MEEMKDGQKVVSYGRTTCVCGAGCTCGCGHRCCVHRAIWWVVGIIILVIVFAIGMRAGEFRNALRNSYGGYYHWYPMMQYGTGYTNGNTVSPAQPGTPTENSSGTIVNPGGPMIPAQQ